MGHGEGDVTGVVAIAGCRREGPYDLNPSSFFAQAPEQLLQIRIQRGSDLDIRSDGLAVLVQDAALVKRTALGQWLLVGGDEQPVVDLTLYLNESCPAERDKTPVTLSAVAGMIRFDAIYAPKVNKDSVRITAEFQQVRFEDPRNEQRWALLDGNFDFLYVRGSPAQRFP